MNHIRPYLFLSRENEDDIRDIGKHDFRSFYFTLCYLMPTEELDVEFQEQRAGLAHNHSEETQ